MIKFLSPAFLFALLLIAIPVIVHLFNFRRFKKVAFTNVRFLKELKQETTSKSKLKHLLVLLSRILAVAFLVFAFARPVLPSTILNTTTHADAVSIYIDNTFTMEAVRKDGTLLEVAQKKAKEIAAAYPPSTRFQLLTADFDPVHQRMLSREEFIDMADQVKVTGDTRSLSDILRRQHEALIRVQQQGGIHYILSDFQANMYDGKMWNDTNEQITFIPIQATLFSNIYIDSCWLSSPAFQLNQPAELFFRIVNDGSEAAENIPVKVNVDGQVKAVTTVAADAGKSIVTSVNFTITQPGWHTGEVSITDHPVTFDDIYYFSFEVKESVNVIALNGHGTSPYLQALYGNNSFVKFSNTNYTQVDYRSLSQNQLLILNELPQISSGLADEIHKYLSSGGHVLMFPDSAADITSYNSFFNTVDADVFTGINSSTDKVTRLDRSNELFADVFQQNARQDGSVDYPLALKHFDVASGNSSNREMLMELQSNAPFLSQYNVGKGSLYIFTVPLSGGFSNLAHHAVFVPALYKMALLSLKGHELAFTSGRDVSITLKGNTSVAEGNFRIVNTVTKNEMIPQSRVTSSGLDIGFNNIIKEAGHYALNADGKLISMLSFNYNRAESNMRLMNEEQMELMMKDNHINNYSTINASVPDLTKKLKQLTDGVSLWKYCIVLVLLFLLVETLLLRFWKT
ncbi:MAG: BatA domain-containing protein [Bacteroidota bacterium]